MSKKYLERQLKRVEDYRADSKEEALEFIKKKMEENENDEYRVADFSYKTIHKPSKQVKGEEVPEWWKITLTYEYAKE